MSNYNGYSVEDELRAWRDRLAEIPTKLLVEDVVERCARRWPAKDEAFLLAEQEENRLLLELVENQQIEINRAFPRERPIKTGGCNVV